MNTEPGSVADSMRWGEDCLKKSGNPMAQRDAQLLLEHVLNTNISSMLLSQTLPSQIHQQSFRRLIERRLTGEPVAYIVGEQAFWSLDFHVDRNTLIPRPDTETLVEIGLERLEAIKTPLIADLGTGSGCILLSLLDELAGAGGIGIDQSNLALDVAKRNAARHGLSDRVDFVISDWFESVSDDRVFDLIVSNPPYIESGQIDGLMKDVKQFEPNCALDGGADGLDCYRAIAVQSRDRLTEEGVLAVEVGKGQALDVGMLFEQAGYRDVSMHKDLTGVQRVVVAKKQ